jgi:hypothetical protein
MNRIPLIAAAIALASSAACRQTGDAIGNVGTVATGIDAQAAVDSCEAAKWSSQDTTAAGHRHPRLTGSVRSYERFALWVPDAAHVTMDTATRGIALAWPDCEKCRFGASVQRDTVPGGLEERIARMIASQKKIDSINKDPATTVGEFDETDGPPQPITTAAGRGYLIDDSCGDCASTTVLFGRRGWLAEINFGSDDDTPEGGRHECEMGAVAKSFVWKD